MNVEYPSRYINYTDRINGPTRFEKARDYIKDELGVRAFTEEELKEIAFSYQQDLLNGLKTEGKGSLLMIDTLLPSVDRENLPKEKEVLVIEIGGTRVRAANVWVDSSGQLQIKPDEDDVCNFIEEELDKIVFSSTDDFLNHLFEKLKSVLGKVKPCALGIIWSFPGDAFKRETGVSVDVYSPEDLTKGFVIPDISQRPIGKIILERLQKKYGFSEMPLAVMNDTRAVGGGIVATGYNLLLGRYNTESGGFSGISSASLETPWIYKEIDKRSENPGLQLAEKQISGKYLGALIQIACRKLSEERLLTQLVDYNTSEFISLVLKMDESFRYKYLDDYTYAVLMYLVAQARKRSAQLVGTMIGTGISTFKDAYPQKTVEYPIEGPVFKYIPGYKELVEYYANEITEKQGIRVVCPEVDHAGIIGAGAVALGLIK